MSVKYQRSLRRNGFTFKHFFVAHDRCAMKVGTDGVLLGAWTPLGAAQRILDIGSGSGLVSLMLAQRSAESVSIVGVEFDMAAAEQSRENVADSPWPQKVEIDCEDIRDYAHRCSGTFELIVSNPPYFEPANPCRDEARNTARYTESLTHEVLLACAEQLLTPEGRLCVILPYEIGLRLQTMALARGWQVGQRLIVRDNPQHPPHRLLLELSRSALTEQDISLAIKQESREYSVEFRLLLKDFYLLF